MNKPSKPYKKLYKEAKTEIIKLKQTIEILESRAQEQDARAQEQDARAQEQESRIATVQPPPLPIGRA